MKCKYKDTKNNYCQLLFIFDVHAPVKGNWCDDTCEGDCPGKQLAMLDKVGYKIPDPPNGVDLLDWAKECILSGKVRLSKLERKIQEKEERANLLHEMPSGFRLVKSFARHLKEIHGHYKKTGIIYVTDERREARLRVCRTCPSKKLVITDKQAMRCADCGCYLDIAPPIPFMGGGKADYDALDCGRGHWPDPTIK